MTVERHAPELSMGTEGQAAPCPHCGGRKTWKTWMRWPEGRKVTFWSCDGCKRAWGREETQGASDGR